MANVTCTFDFGLKILSEPGFGKELTTEQLATLGHAHDDGSQQTLWADPLTGTVCLKPLQLDSTWLNSENALPWIIRLAQMDVNAADLAAGYIQEKPAFGNIANPWIYHIGTTPSGYFPAARPPGDAPERFPTADPSLTGISPGYDPVAMDALTIRPNSGYAQPTTLPPPPPAAPPTPVKTVTTSTGRFIAQTPQVVANQALFLRWYQVQSDLGFPPVYRFYIGQFALDIKDVVVQVYQDDSAAGDRSHYKHVATLPLFTVNDYSLKRESIAYRWQIAWGNVDAIFGHDRWLLWLPCRRNQVILYSSAGQSRMIQTRPVPKRLPDNSDWDIVRRDKIGVWFLTPHWGRFQIQQVAYSKILATADFPPVTLDFTPASAPDLQVYADIDHGTAISITQSQPPSYNLPVNNANDCPVIPAGIASIQTRQYGYQAVFASSPAGDWTPFFYNLKVTRGPTLVASSATPHAVNDTNASPPSGSAVLSCEFTAGLNPGEGKATIHVSDFKTYDLNNYYYRSGNPVQIKNGADAAFTGYTLPPGVEPLKLQDTHPRRIVFTAADRWWQLTKTYLRDNRDWTGIGHIDCVKTVMQEGGVDIAGMDVPASTPMNNQVLGLISPQQDLANVAAIRSNGPWQPRPGETAASFIQRVARNFSGWVVGFDASGVPFYHPRYQYVSSELTLYESAAAAVTAGDMDPRFYRKIVFSTIEPEANVILVKANSKQTGSPLYSSIYIDWASIKNPAVVNYLGRYKPEVVEIFGAYSCQGINWAARTIWDQTRRRHVLARFECDYDKRIKVGHVLTLHGTPAGYGNYRVLSYTARFRKPTVHLMTVEAEFVEKGYGLPTGSPT